MKWYGYRLKNGQMKLRAMSDNVKIAADELKEASESTFVADVFGPFEADTRQEATQELLKLAALP